MRLISDNLDNAQAHHILGKSKKVNLNPNFADENTLPLISEISWNYNLKHSTK